MQLIYLADVGVGSVARATHLGVRISRYYGGIVAFPCCCVGYGWRVGCWEVVVSSSGLLLAAGVDRVDDRLKKSIVFSLLQLRIVRCRFSHSQPRFHAS